MELRPDRTLSRVGLIPAEWISTTVGEMVESGLIEKPLDGNHGEIHPKSGDFVDFGVPFVMANNVQRGQVDLGVWAAEGKSLMAREAPER